MIELRQRNITRWNQLCWVASDPHVAADQRRGCISIMWISQAITKALDRPQEQSVIAHIFTAEWIHYEGRDFLSRMAAAGSN